MTESENERRTPRLTARGAATKARVVRAAANLFYAKGVNATTLDDVRAASGTSKSQLYHHFPEKNALVREAIALQAQTLLECERQHLERLNSFRGLQRWRDVLIQLNGLHNGAYGCPLGSMANELADQDEEARSSLAAHLASWESLIAAGLRRMRDNGPLRADADPDKLATGLLAALQGGYLLAKTARDIKPMEIALDMALDQVKTYLTE